MSEFEDFPSTADFSSEQDAKLDQSAGKKKKKSGGFQSMGTHLLAWTSVCLLEDSSDHL